MELVSSSRSTLSSCNREASPPLPSMNELFICSFLSRFLQDWLLPPGPGRHPQLLGATGRGYYGKSSTFCNLTSQEI